MNEDGVVATTGGFELPSASIEDLNTDHEKDLDIRRHTQTYAPLARSELAGRIKMQRLRKELGLISEEEEQESIAKLQDNFDKRFDEEKEAFEIESHNERSVAEVSKNKRVLFVHSIPFDDIDSQANTSMNNQLISTEEMNTEERIGMIIHEQPSISCSTVSLDTSPQYGTGFKAKTMYPFGLVVDEGTILSAHRNDGGIETISRTAKHRKYDTQDKDSSIQPNIEAQIEYAIEGNFSREYDRKFEARYGEIDKGYSGTSHKDYNELVIAEPHISGFFIDAVETYKLEEQAQYRAPQMKIDKYNFTGVRWKKMKDFVSKYPDVPIYIRERGVITEYVFIDGKIRPIREEGKIDIHKPSRELGDYEFSHASHLKSENMVEQRKEHIIERGFYMLTMENLGKIIEEVSLPIHYSAGSWKYSRENARMLIKIAEGKNLDKDTVFEAVQADYKRAQDEINDTVKSIKQKVTADGPENIYGRDSYIRKVPEYKESIKLGLIGFIEGIAGAYPDLAERLRGLVK